MMKNPNANLEGMLRLIPASKKTLSPVFEAITNSLESILERSSSDTQRISVTLYLNDFDENHKELVKIVISDTGAGFNSVSFQRFNELLNKSKGYHNRGTGRLQFFHRFSLLKVDSYFEENNERYYRSFKCSQDSFIYDEHFSPSTIGDTVTKIELSGFKPQKQDHEYLKTLTIKKFESLLKSYFALRAYLENQNGITFPELALEFKYTVSKKSEKVIIEPNNFPEPSQCGSFSVPYSYPVQNHKIKGGVQWLIDKDREPENFKWLVFEFDADSVKNHGAFLCSKDIPVEHIKNPTLNSLNSLYKKRKIAAFYGDYLDQPENVNDSVDSFTIESKSGVKTTTRSLFGNDSYVYIDDIKKKINEQLTIIYEELADAKEATSKRVMLLARELGVSSKIAEITKGKVKINASDETITQALHVELAKVIANKSNQARAVIQELNLINPTSENYQKEMEEKSRKISALVDEQNKEELSKYVVRRELVTNLLDKVVNSKLDIQNEILPKGQRKDKEGIIHDLFFKRKTSGEINDLWILDEEFLHYEGFSEMELSKLTLPNGESLLQEGAFKEMAEMGFKPNQRPDVYLYAGEGKCILLEFKAQDVDLSDYLQQMPKYCNLLANYANVKIEKFYCYLIGENISPMASLNEYERSVLGSWYRDSIPVKSVDENNWKTIANIRMEIIKLSDVVKRAHIRNHSFADKLGLTELLPKRTHKVK